MFCPDEDPRLLQTGHILYVGNLTSLRVLSWTVLPAGASLLFASSTTSFSSAMMLLPIWLIKTSIGTSAGGSDMLRRARLSCSEKMSIIYP
jgi:hypothetical protein